MGHPVEPVSGRPSHADDLLHPGWLDERHVARDGGWLPSGASLSAGPRGSSGGISGAGSEAGISDGGSGGMSGSGISDMAHIIHLSVPQQIGERHCRAALRQRSADKPAQDGLQSDPRWNARASDAFHRNAQHRWALPQTTTHSFRSDDKYVRQSALSVACTLPRLLCPLADLADAPAAPIISQKEARALQ